MEKAHVSVEAASFSFFFLSFGSREGIGDIVS